MVNAAFTVSQPADLSTNAAKIVFISLCFGISFGAERVGYSSESVLGCPILRYIGISR